MAVDLFGQAPVVRVIDFEGTGLERDAEVVEVGHCDFDPVSLNVSRGTSYLCRVKAMPPEVRAIHHIRLEESNLFPPYDRRCLYEHAVRQNVVAFAAHNAEYEAKFILGDIPLVCTYKAANRVWPDAPGHSVFALLYWLEDQGLVDYDRVLAHPPHRAGPDAYATAHLLRAIYAAGYTGRDLLQWTREPTYMAKCPIGDWRGYRWEDVEFSFLEWICRKFEPGDILWNAQRELDRRDEELRNARSSQYA